jgi:hypothetical protein
MDVILLFTRALSNEEPSPVFLNVFYNIHGLHFLQGLLPEAIASSRDLNRIRISGFIFDT